MVGIIRSEVIFQHSLWSRRLVKPEMIVAKGHVWAPLTDQQKWRFGKGQNDDFHIDSPMEWGMAGMECMDLGVLYHFQRNIDGLFSGFQNDCATVRCEFGRYELDENASGICHGRNLSVLISMRNSLQISPIPPGFGSKPFGDNTSLKLFEAMQQHGIHNFTTFTRGQPRPLSTTLVVFSSMWKHVTVKPWLNHGGCRALYNYIYIDIWNQWIMDYLDQGRKVMNI